MSEQDKALVEEFPERFGVKTDRARSRTSIQNPRASHRSRSARIGFHSHPIQVILVLSLTGRTECMIYIRCNPFLGTMTFILPTIAKN